MKKKQVLVGLGTVAIVAGLSNQVKADETTKKELGNKNDINTIYKKQ